MLTDVGSAAAGFTVALMPAGLGRSTGRILTAFAGSVAFTATAWPVAGDRAAVGVAAGAAAGLVARSAIGAVLARASRRR
jgi:hypothetical protein